MRQSQVTAHGKLDVELPRDPCKLEFTLLLSEKFDVWSIVDLVAMKGLAPQVHL